MKINAAPMNQKLWTRGFKIGVFFVVLGMALLMIRFIFGLGSITNLSDGMPWGLWIAFDVVCGIALAAGGFTTAAMVYIFNRGQYSPLVRPAILTALFGYALAGFGVFFDIGRWWQIYNPALPQNWQGNSALFEVSLCVMSYLVVLLLEFIPTLTEQWQKHEKGFLKAISKIIHPILNKVAIVFVLLGVVISTLHQSSLGSVMLLAKYNLHALWWTPWLPLMFLISAIAVGFPMVVFESTLSAKAFKRKPETPILSNLIKVTPWILGFYLILRLWDIVYFNKFALLASKWGILLLLEIMVFAVIPIIILSNPKKRADAGCLFRASTMVIVGLLLNRFNTYLFAYSPRPGWTYFPSAGEIMVSVGMVSILFVGYKVVANYFPVLERQE